MQRQLQRLLNIVLEHTDDAEGVEEDERRVLSTPFYQLPKKKDYPEYYEVIKKPMDFERIQKKLKNHQFRSIDDMERDISLLCKNAQEFNVESSLIYEDSIVLYSVFTEARKRLREDETAKARGGGVGGADVADAPAGGAPRGRGGGGGQVSQVDVRLH